MRRAPRSSRSAPSSAGQSTLELAYARSFEPGVPPAKTATFPVTVTGVALSNRARSTTHSGRTSALARPAAGPKSAPQAGTSTSTTTSAVVPAARARHEPGVVADRRRAGRGARRTRPVAQRQPVGGGEGGRVGRRLRPGPTDQRAAESGRTHRQHQTDDEHPQHQRRSPAPRSRRALTAPPASPTWRGGRDRGTARRRAGGR